MARTRKRSVGGATRARLLHHGRQIIARSGLSGLTVRKLAARARVNLGTFVYHFGTREAFIAEVMESWYAPIYAQLKVTADEALPPLERLRRFLLQFSAFFIANRPLVRSLIMDALGGERAAIRFIQSLAGRHPALLFQLIGAAQQSGALPAGNPLQYGAFLWGATLMPSLWVGVLLPDQLIPKAKRAMLRQFAVAPAEIERRFQWALAGLAGHTVRPPEAVLIHGRARQAPPQALSAKSGR